MEKNEFLRKILKEIRNRKPTRELTRKPKFYFIMEQATYLKRKTGGAVKYNEEYYFSVAKRSVALTDSAEKLFNFIKNKYGKIPIVFSTPQFVDGKSVYVGLIKDEIDFSKIPKIKEYLNTKKSSALQKITACLMKQIRLKDTDKIAFVYAIGEGRPAGEFEETSGDAITSTKIVTSFWLKFDEKKGYYLDYVNPIKIKELK